MIQNPDQRPMEPTVEQAERFRAVFARVMSMTEHDGSLYGEQVGSTIGVTLEEPKFYPLPVGPDEEPANETTTIILYYDFILFSSGQFARHVTYETLDEKTKREKETGVVGPITRNKQSTDESQIIDASDQDLAIEIHVHHLNELVNLGKVNPLELDQAMKDAEEILIDLE